MRNKKVAIIGTGIDGLRCMNMLICKKTEKPECFVVNNAYNDSFFCGYKVLELEKSNIQNKFVLVATKESTYFHIRKQLEDMGFSEFDDFIYYEWMFKKLVFLHGNCHMDIVESYLRSSRVFCDSYSIYPNPRICVNTDKKVDLKVLTNVNVWIHEDIRDDNGLSYYLSDSYIRKFINKSVVEITIPHLFGLGKLFFPYSDFNKKNAWLSNNLDRNGMFPHSDALIDYCVTKKWDINKIIEYCLNENAMKESEVVDNFSVFMKKIISREKNWDIKISDFILGNYKYKKLFYDMGHPTNIILEYITKEILAILGIADEISTDSYLDYHEVPVYPTVRKHLQLEWKEEKIRKSALAKRIALEMDIEEYIREYLFWCYQM